MEKNWDEIKSAAEDYATRNPARGMNCAEAVLDACIRSGALDADADYTAFATGFGGGGGVSGYTCGALSAAILANSIAHGRRELDADPPAVLRAELRERVYKRYNNIVADFLKESVSGLCREIIGQFAGGYADADARENCVRLCGVAARIAVDYLQLDEDDADDLEYDESAIGIPNWTVDS